MILKDLFCGAFGSGDVGERFIPALEYLKGKEIPIVITTQSPNGTGNFQVNELGQKIKESDLAIPA
jgi:L-asparaginase